MQTIDRGRPLFTEVPDEIDESWQHGFVIVGMVHHTDPIVIARAYVDAGDLVIDHATDRGEAWEVAYPALFLYRHAIELYLKAIVQPQRLTHDLATLIAGFTNHVARRHGQPVPDWFEAYLMEFANIDPRSTAFRYVDDNAKKPLIDTLEGWVEFAHLRKVVGLLAGGLERVYFGR